MLVVLFSVDLMHFVVLLLLCWFCVFGCVDCVNREEVLLVARKSTIIAAAPALFWRSNSNSNSFSRKFIESLFGLIRNATPSTYTLQLYSKSSMSGSIPSIGACSLGTGSVEKCSSTHEDITKVTLTSSTSSKTAHQHAAAAWKARTDTSITATSDEDESAVLQATPTTTTANRCCSRHALLGGEPCLLLLDDEHVELERVEEMLQLLTVDEKQAMPDAAMPIRHLRAEKGNVNKAVEKLRLALIWRKDFHVDSLLACMNDDDTDDTIDKDEKRRRKHYRSILMQEADTGKIYIRGYTVDGRAIMYMRPARENTNNEDGNMKHLVWNLEKAIACTKKRSSSAMMMINNNNNNSCCNNDDRRIQQQPKEKVVLLIDYTNFKLSNAPPLSTSRLTLDILQKHYPERMHCAYLLNTPFFFNAFWTIIKPFVDPVTKDKIIFCNRNTNCKGLQKLHAHVGGVMEHLEDSVPGGTIPTTDPTTFDTQAYLTMLPYDESL